MILIQRVRNNVFRLTNKEVIYYVEKSMEL